MKKCKRVLIALLTGVMTASMSLTAFAATGVSDSEQKILDKAAAVRGGYTMTANQEKKYNDAMAQATSYLQSNDLNDDQVNSIVGALENASAALSAACPDGDLTKLSAADKKALASTVASALQAGADAAGINVSISSNGTATFTSVQTGKPVASTDKTVKTTGAAAGTTAAVIAAMVVVLGGCVLAAKKKKMFA